MLLQAKRLFKELQAQIGAAEAAQALDTVMAKRPCGSATLKSAVMKAEAAASAVVSSSSTAAVTATNSSSGSTSGSASCSNAFSEALLPRIQGGKKRLEVEKAAETLYKAALNHRQVADLPKLEGAILNARKVRERVMVADWMHCLMSGKGFTVAHQCHQLVCSLSSIATACDCSLPHPHNVTAGVGWCRRVGP